MLLIWGWRTKIFQLAMVTFLCGACGNPSAHAIHRAVTKFTLFFIPLFPINVKYSTQCTFCGAQNRITKEQALQAAAQGVPQQQPAAPAYPQQQMPPQQQQIQHPQQTQYPQGH